MSWSAMPVEGQEHGLNQPGCRGRWGRWESWVRDERKRSGGRDALHLCIQGWACKMD